MHRRENHFQIKEYFKVINKLAGDNKHLNFILPIHPNPNVYRHKDILTNVDVMNPVSYNEMLKLLSGCSMIISDSGGIQEEASFFNKKVIVCRKVTERPESVGIHSFLCDSPNKLESMFYDIVNDGYEINEKCPYGDGKSAEKILEVFKGVFND